MLELKLEVYTEDEGLGGRIYTHIDARCVATGGSGLRIESDVLGEGDIVVQGKEKTKPFDCNLPGKLPWKGITELNLLDLEVRTVKEGEGR